MSTEIGDIPIKEIKSEVFSLPAGFEGPKEVVAVRQELPEDCLAACVYSILASIYKGNLPDYEELIKELGTTKEGVDDDSGLKRIFQKYQVRYLEHNTKKQNPKEPNPARVDTIKAALRQGFCCLIEYQAPDSDYNPETLSTGLRPHAGKSTQRGHYSLVIGIKESDSGTELLLMDPLIDEGETVYGMGVRAVGLDLFQKRWKNSTTTEGEWMLEISLNP